MAYNRRDIRRRELAAAITARLSRVRGNMTDQEFARLIADVAHTAERFAEIEGRWPADRDGDREAMRRLLADE
jgi:hypothetical protein